MRRALRASRVVAYVVAQFLYLAFEEAMCARAARAEGPEPTPCVPSVHDVPTLPGVVPAPVFDLAAPAPVIRILQPAQVTEPEVEERAENDLEIPEPVAPMQWLPAVLMDPSVIDSVSEPARDEGLDVSVLLDTLRRDVGCSRSTTPKTHEACRAAERLADFVDTQAVLSALEETVTAAARPGCVRISAVGALGRASRGAARRALERMLGVARSRAAWTSASTDRDLVALLLHTLDA